MTYTKRQWFIYRLKQCINHLTKVAIYIEVVNDYVLFSKYGKRISKITRILDKQVTKLQEFLDEVK